MEMSDNMDHPESTTRPEGNWVVVKQQMREIALREMREEESKTNKQEEEQ